MRFSHEAPLFIFYLSLLQSLRDGCYGQGGSQWHLLTNYHIRTLVLLAYTKNPDKFECAPRAELLLQVRDLFDQLFTFENCFSFNAIYVIMNKQFSPIKAQFILFQKLD